MLFFQKSRTKNAPAFFWLGLTKFNSITLRVANAIFLVLQKW